MKPLGALALLALAAGWAVAAPAEPPSPAETQLPIDAPAANSHDTAQPQIVGVEALLSSLTDPRQSGPLAPRDDCGALGGANAFRRELSDVVIRRDIEALVGLADIDIKLDFGGGEGRAELRLRLSDPDSRLWQELDKVLPLGCAVNSQGGITLPWYFAQDFGDLDTFATMIVLGEDVPLRAEPRTDGQILKRFSWDAVELKGDMGGHEDFALIGDYRGGEGYVAQAKLRSLIDYRLIAKLVGGKWRITALVAGD